MKRVLEVTSDFRKLTSIGGLMVASLIVTLGTFWAYDRGANDFTVFYAAWKLVLHGSAMDIYRATPDRFLYAPGFAWLFAPLAWLPRNVSLALWCLAKVALIGWMLREFSKPLLPQNLGPAIAWPGQCDRESSASERVFSAGLVAWGVLLIARPVLIDFQYGQVNLLILGACVWALVRHADIAESPCRDFIGWFVLAVAAVGKLFPIPLMAVPFFVNSYGGTRLSRKKLRIERAGLLAGVVVTLLIPLCFVGFDGWLSLMQQWKQALIDRGFPLESHNQSFGAFLQHYTSGKKTEIIAQHRRELSLGFAPSFREHDPPAFDGVERVFCRIDRHVDIDHAQIHASSLAFGS